MDSSYELLSSMSPRLNKGNKPIRRPPTKLALKSYFRKSLSLTHARSHANDVSVISVKSSSTCSSSSSRKNQPPLVVISDSDTSCNVERSLKESKEREKEKEPERRMDTEKLVNIQSWVDNVNSAKQDITLFTDLSAICGDGNPGFLKSNINKAVNSTMLDSQAPRLDELFSTKKKTEDSSLDDDFLSCENECIEDSFEIKPANLITRIAQKSSPANASPEEGVSDSKDFEDILDKLYGNSWRKNKDEILPSSVPKKNVPKKIPNTERCKKTEIPNVDGAKKFDSDRGNRNVLNIKRSRQLKVAQSPWSSILKNLCDSDTDSDTENRVLPTKLNFDDDGSSSGGSRADIKVNTRQVNVAPLRSKENDDKKIYSFLASLSGCVPRDKCDFVALAVRENYKEQKEALALRLFGLFNENVFNNSIPKDTLIEWNCRLRGTAGLCTCKKITRRNGAVERTVKITLANKVLDSADRLRDTLIHEMCHAAAWIVNEVSDGHGPFWKSWANRAMKVYPELPPIKRCHNYTLNTKYTYRCVQCGYCVGRHTKSLNTDRKRCGYCLGTFEILINKTTKDGTTKSMPATPKKATGFALFVKENYSSVKKPDLKHGDVMKLLGQKFADLKVKPS